MNKRKKRKKTTVIKISYKFEFPRKAIIIFAFLPFYLGMTILPIMSSVIDNMIDAWLILSLALISINVLKKGIRINTFKRLVLAYFTIIVISTLYNEGDVIRMIKIIACIAMIIILMDYAIQMEYVFFLDFISKLTIAVTVLNIVTILFFPGGFNVYNEGVLLVNRYLLGMDNRFCCTLFPGFCFVMLNDIRTHGKIGRQSWVEYGLLLFTFGFTQAMGSLLSVLVILPILMVINTKYAKKVFHGMTYFITQTVMAYLITFVRIFDKMAVILGYLGKDVTLTSRTFIWNKAQVFINASPWIGLGIESNDVMKKKFALNHLHNQLLTVIYQTGYIGLTVFLAVVGHVYYLLYKNRNSLEAQVIALIMFLIFVQLLTDTADNVRNHLFWMMAIGSNIDVIIQKNNQKTQNN